MPKSLGIKRIIRGVRVRISPTFRGRVRDALARVDNTEVRNARRLVKRLRKPPAPDVIYLADSAGIFNGPNDKDKRGLVHMVWDELAGEIDVYPVMGPGYSVYLHEAYLRLIEEGPVRPLIVHSMWMRGWFTAFSAHPAWGKRAEAVEAIQHIDASGPLWRMRASVPKPGAPEFEAYHRIRHPTIIGDLTVGDYVNSIKNGSLTPEEKVRMLYGYHYAYDPTPENSDIAAVTRLGARLRELGCKTIAYHTPIPVETGAEIFGPSFAEQVERNWAANDAAYREGIGRDATILQSGTAFEPSEFVDPAEAIEHLNDVGRRRLASWIIDAIRDELARD